MKNFGLVAGMLLGVSTGVFAAPVSPCGTASLASFIALGSTGCSVGDLQFSGFAALASPAGSTALAPSAITVSPLATLMPGLLFTLNASSSSVAIFDANIGFNVTPVMGATNLINDSTLTQNGGMATGIGIGGGSVTGVEMICVGAAFVPTGCPVGTLASRNLGTFAVEGLTQTTDNLVFGPTSLAGIVGDFSVGGGGRGTASVTSFGINISEVAGRSPAIPEPATFLLTGCALLGLGFGRRWYSQRARS